MRFNLLLTSGLFALLAAAALAQRGGFQRMQQPDDPYERVADRREAEFHFIRLEYTDLPQFHRRFGCASRAGMGEGWWVVDWPAADNHFTAGIQRLTRIDTGDPGFTLPKPAGGTSATSKSPASANSCCAAATW